MDPSGSIRQWIESVNDSSKAARLERHSGRPPHY